jgi:hypothetical protein
MTISDRERAQETIAEAAEVRRATEDAFLFSMRTELVVVRTMCILAEQEDDGEERAHHIQQAEKAFASILDVAKRIDPNQQDRDAIEEARQNIRRVGGREFPQPHD